jgi:hypothetical protein
VFRPLREYALAVAKKWWAGTGFLLTLIAYLALVFSGFSISALWWLVVSLAVLAAAQYAVFQDLKRSIPTVAEPPPQMAMWAYHVASANSNGAWLTVLMWGDRGGAAWDSVLTQELISASLNTLGVDASSVDVQLTAHFLSVHTPKGDGTPIINVQLDGEPPTVLWHWRTQDDPVDLVWVLDRLETSFSFLMSPVTEKLVRPNPRRTLLLGLSGWPAGGISANILPDAHQPYQRRFVTGSRSVSPHQSLFGRDDARQVLSDFSRRILQDAGFVDFESNLAAEVNRRIDRLYPRSASSPDEQPEKRSTQR